MTHMHMGSIWLFIIRWWDVNVALMTSTSFDVKLDDTTNDNDEVMVFSNLYCDELVVSLSELLGKI